MRVRLVREKTRHVCDFNLLEIKRRRRMEESETNEKGEALKQPLSLIRVITISLSLSLSLSILLCGDLFPLCLSLSVRAW